MFDYRNPYSVPNPYSNQNMNMNMPQMPQVQDNVIIPVQNEQEARNYLVAPGHSVNFKDENKPMVFYAKTVISQFEPPIFKIFDMVERTPESPVNAPQHTQTMDLSIYATKDEIQAVQKELQALKKALGEGDKA